MLSEDIKKTLKSCFDYSVFRKTGLDGRNKTLNVCCATDFRQNTDLFDPVRHVERPDNIYRQADKTVHVGKSAPVRASSVSW